jgi:hypothetical protein
VVAKKSLTTPLVKSRYTYESWDEWLSHYSPTRQDGLWLADGTASHPNFSLHDLKAEALGQERPSGDPALLASLVGVGGDGSIGGFLTIDSTWSSPDGVRVIVSSALVPVVESNAAARALGTAPPGHVWLPRLEHYDDNENDR